MREKRCLKDFPITYSGFCSAVVTAWAMLETDRGGACGQGLDMGLKELVLHFCLLRVKNGWGQTDKKCLQRGSVQAAFRCVCLLSDSCNSLAGAKGQKGRHLSPPLSPACLLHPAVPDCSLLGPRPWSLCATSLRQKTLELKTSTDHHQKARKTQCVCFSKEEAVSYNFRECTRNRIVNNTVSRWPVTAPLSEPALPYSLLALASAARMGCGTWGPPVPGAPVCTWASLSEM